MKSEAGRVLAFALGDRFIAAPSHAPYPSTVPMSPEPDLDQPWWSERLLLRHLGQMALLRMYTQPAGLVQ